MSFISDIFAGGIEGIINSVTNAIRAVKADPTKVVELEAAVEQAKIALISLSVQADAASQAAVNQAMQAESKSEHFLQYSWRPLAAYILYAIVLNNYVVTPYLSKYGLVVLTIPDSLYLMFGAILGVTAWHRGVVQVEETKQKGTNGHG